MPKSYLYNDFEIEPGRSGAFTCSGVLQGCSTDILHHHHYHQVLIISKGAAILETDSRKMIQSNGIAVFLPAHIPHRSLSVGTDTTYVSLYVGKKAFEPSRRDTLAFEISKLGKTLMESLTKRQEALLDQYFEIKCLSLFLDVLKDDMNRTTDANHFIIPSSSDKYVSRTLRFLESHYREAISIDDLKKCAYLSYRQLSRVFGKELGISPFNYLRNIRLQRAALDIRNSNKSITAVALDNGYLCVPLFYKEFKKHYGMTPAKYRLCQSHGTNGESSHLF